MVQISVFTTPRVRLHFPDTQALCHTFTEEFIRLVDEPNDAANTPGFSFDKHITDAIAGALSCLCLPLEAQTDIPKNGVMVITLDVNALLLSVSPSVAIH